MYSVKMYNRHVESCQEVVESLRSGDVEEAERARDDLRRDNLSS